MTTFAYNPNDLQGEGLGDWFRSAGNALKNAHNYIKKGKYISGGVRLYGRATNNDAAIAKADQIESLGYGSTLAMPTTGRVMVARAPRVVAVRAVRTAKKPGPKKGHGGRPKKVGRPKGS